MNVSEMSLFMENPAFQEPLSYAKFIIGVDPYRDGETPVLVVCKKMKSFALVRADDSDKVKIALHDLERYGHIQFSANPKCIEPNYADELLVSIMGVSLRSKCNSAALVELNNHAGAAISRLKKIHPPAHIIIISPRHKMFEELAVKFSKYPEFDRTFNHQKNPRSVEMIQEKGRTSNPMHKD